MGALAHHLWAQHRDESILTPPQDMKGRSPLTHQPDMSNQKQPVSNGRERLQQRDALDLCIGSYNRSSIGAHHQESQCLLGLPLGDHPGMFHQAHHAHNEEMGRYPISPAKEPQRKELACTRAQCKDRCGYLPNPEDLGKAPQLPTDLASFLEWLEETTKE